MANLFDDDMDEFDNPFLAEADSAEKAEDAVPVAPVEVTPQSNPDLLGHEDIEKLFLTQFNGGHLPHAVVLSGAAGIGKLTLAYRLARFLLSQTEEAGPSLFGDPVQPESLYVPPDNPVFRRVASGGHADLMRIGLEFNEKTGKMQTEISVDTIRRIHSLVGSKSAEGGWRVVIVEDAEYMSLAAQNALLKVLEEPPSKTILILVTAQYGSLLPTVRSRCRMLPMHSLSEKNMNTLLDKFAPGMSSEQKTALGRLSEGSIGKALTYQSSGGMDVYKTLLKNIENLPQLDMEAIHSLSEKYGKRGAESSFDTAADIMLRWCGRLARLEARDQAIGDILSGDGAIFQKIMATYPPRYFLGAWDRLSKLFRLAEQSNLDKRQTLIDAFLILQKPDYTGPSL